MDYLLRLTDASGQKMVVLSLDDTVVKAPSIDVVFEILGHENAEDLVINDILAGGQIDDFKALQQAIFDRDGQGLFIRDAVSFKVNGKELDPDAPMIQSFVSAEREGAKYMRCDLVLESAVQAQASPPVVAGKAAQASTNSADQLEQIREFGRLMFLHQIAYGFVIDVTKNFPELTDVIQYAESKGWIEVDVEKVKYKLTEAGKAVYQRYITEARDLIRRFDIYADVDVDSSGRARFCTNLGQDLRVPAFEMEGIDPFRARFLLGLNDGEWNQLSNWFELFENPSWYAEIFEPVERAPSVEDIGRQRMASIIDQAKNELRQDQY